MTNEILFRSSQKEDLSFILNAELSAHTLGFVALWTEGEHLKAMERENTFHEIIEYNDRRVGYVIMNLDQHDNLELMRLVITEKHQGFGTKAIEAIKKRAFEVLNCNRLWLDVRLHNQSAIRLYEFLGFIEEGVLRKAVKLEEDYVSVKVMSILKEEYEV
ncbi:MAG: GNAT family N-acetyltransferase [Clostridia bacterium]|nr:GNAT family N-acetyltransferase [Clostridia bacterium]